MRERERGGVTPGGEPAVGEAASDIEHALQRGQGF